MAFKLQGRQAVGVPGSNYNQERNPPAAVLRTNNKKKHMIAEDERTIEQRARRAARKVRLAAHKSRWRLNSIDNFGGFQVVDPYRNAIVAGERFDMSAEQVIEFCQHQAVPQLRSRGFRVPWRFERRANN